MLYILYTTDFNHSHSSKTPIGHYVNKSLMYVHCSEIIKTDINTNSDDELTDEEKDDLSDERFRFLVQHNQTQGLNSFELVIEEVKLNTYEKDEVMKIITENL